MSILCTLTLGLCECFLDIKESLNAQSYFSLFLAEQLEKIYHLHRTHSLNTLFFLPKLNKIHYF